MPYNYNFLGSKDNIYSFKTQHFFTYQVKFKPTGYIFENYIWSYYAYEMVIEVTENLSGKRPPLDSDIPPTIAIIFEDFFREKEKIAVYTCETADGKHLARARKFDGWFKDFNPLIFLKIDRFISDRDLVYFNSIILRHDNPFKNQILEAFDELNDDLQEEK
jgi:hypothetical protein